MQVDNQVHENFLKRQRTFWLGHVMSLNIDDQSHYIKVMEEDIFMEQKMVFGLVLGWLAILKKRKPKNNL